MLDFSCDSRNLKSKLQIPLYTPTEPTHISNNMTISKHMKTEHLFGLAHQRMPSDDTHVVLDRVSIEASNIGSVMSIRNGSCGSKDPPMNPCSINIYVNNNIQGVSNSILFGSEVKMGDSGVHFSFEDVIWDRKGCLRRRKKRSFNGFSAFFGGLRLSELILSACLLLLLVLLFF